ncbi:glia maturation factor gamma-like [Asterias rubens]|uniref:glia maturation factor gamma-like n=1 Tax=Asterias rubens TaxID=7604 RepID=UPI0014550540|nr:glia maturation factor gamma-like [Asterias rubens]
MAQAIQVCEIDEELKAQLKKFRFRKDKNISAIVCKIKETTVIIDEQYEDISLEDLQEEVPSTQARFIFLSYCLNHSDGRISYPLCFIYLHPRGTKPEQGMKYSGTKLHLQKESGVTKCFDLTSVEDLTKEWLEGKLSFFG